MKAPDFAIVVFNVLLLAVALHFVPLIRKRNLYFGVTVDEAFRHTEAARRTMRNYRLMIWTVAAACIAVLSLAFRMGWAPLAGLTPLVQVAGVLLAWAVAWKRTRPHAAARPSPPRAAALAGSEPGLPLGLAGIVLPFLGPAAAIWHLWSGYAQLPERYPVHWNAYGQADRFAGKSLLVVLFPPLMSMAVLLLLALLALAIAYRSRRGSSGERAGWSARHRRLNLLMLVSLMWILSAWLSITSFGSVIPSDTMRLLTWGGAALLLAVILGLGIPLIRMNMEATGGTDATPDDCWRWGYLYYNPSDPALVVEKRDGPGFTLNFGNRLAWAILAMILVIAILPLVFIART